MNYLLDPFNLILWFVVISFWATVILLSRAKHRPVSARLLMVPVIFGVVGMAINLYYPRWGTYMVALTHVIMLPALARIANSKS